MRNLTIKKGFFWLSILTMSMTMTFACTRTSNNSDDSLKKERPAGEAWITNEQFAKSIETKSVGHRTLTSKVISTGRITFDDTKVSHLFSPVTGRVEKLIANIGDEVKAGAPLCTINSPDLGSAHSDVVKAKADLTAAEHDFKRKKELVDVHAATQSDLEQSEDNYQKAKAEMERASLKFKMWKITKEDEASQQFTLRAPIDGMVLMRNANPGIEVQGVYSGANIANELYTVGDYSSIWVYIDLYEIDMAHVQKDQEVLFSSVSYPGEVFKGKVSLISQVIDPNTRTARVRCNIANPDHKLKPEMYVTTEIFTGTKSALAVPKEAVVRLADQTVVFKQISKVIESKEEAESHPGIVRFQAVPVVIGNEDDHFSEIIGNTLHEGDLVVAKGTILMSSSL